MSILGCISRLLVNVYVLGILLLLAVASLLFPVKAVTFKRDHPMVFTILLMVAVLIQLPLLAGGWWGASMRCAEHTAMARTVDYTFIALLPILYVAIGVISVRIQASRKELKTASAGMAFFASLIISPLLYFVLVAVLERMVM
jgi:hypothetical protein